MQLVNDLRNSYQAEEKKNEWVKQNEMRNKINEAVSSIVHTVKTLAKTGHFEILKDGKRRIHFYLGHSFPMTFEFMRHGKGVIRGTKERKTRITIDLNTEEAKYFFESVKAEVEKQGITCKGPYISSYYGYHVFNEVSDYDKVVVMTSACTINSKRKVFVDWNVHYSYKEVNPYKPYTNRSDVFGKTSYLPVLEIEIIY